MLRDFYSSSRLAGMIEYRWMRRELHGWRHTWKDNTNMDLREVGCELNWIQVG